MTTITYSNELYHHGVKGMRWGVRRYQNADGSLTKAGKKRYNNSDGDSSNNTKSTKSLISKHQAKLEETYIRKGMSREDAQKAAKRRITTEKILAVTAGVTVAAATAYVINKRIKERTDGIIKAGTSMKRIEGQKKMGLFGNLDANLHNDFYATNNEYDNKNYHDAFGYMKKANPRYGKAYQLDIEATQDIKVASQKRAKETLKDLVNNNKEFRETLSDRLIEKDLRKQHGIDKKYIDAFKKGKKVPDRIMRKIYDNYNTMLVYKGDKDWDKNHKIFYDALKKQGYGSIQDINDLKFSHLRGKNPLIVFDKTKTKVKSITDITDKVSREKQISAYSEMQKLVGKQALARSLPTLATVSTAWLARNVAVDNINYKYHKEKEEYSKNSKKSKR